MCCNFLKGFRRSFTVRTTYSRPSIEMVGFMYLLLCRVLVVGPVLKWLAYVSMYVCISPCSLPWPDRIRLRGRTWPKGFEIYF